MLIIAETKLDESYPDALFKVDNYHFWRKDRTSHGGGLLMYVIGFSSPHDLLHSSPFYLLRTLDCSYWEINRNKWLSGI
jgi:hypothetical protein